ncbi:hypothetical protein [Robinsoniella peoriensis]|uniref:hypothetical protein n=1 Tax=Robinsoniella peoriensis TaxID=180332 RepID=UPI003628E295
MYGKMGVGNWHGLRQLAAELVFSNLSEALFGGTRAFAAKCIRISERMPACRQKVLREG